LLDFILTEEQRKEMTLEEQLKDLQEKLDMTQAIKHGGKYSADLNERPLCCFLVNIAKINSLRSIPQV